MTDLTPGIYTLTATIKNPLVDRRKSAWFRSPEFAKGKEFIVRADEELPGRLTLAPNPPGHHVALTLNAKVPRPQSELAETIGANLEPRPVAGLSEMLNVIDRSAFDALSALLRDNRVTLTDIKDALNVPLFVVDPEDEELVLIQKSLGRCFKDPVTGYTTLVTLDSAMGEPLRFAVCAMGPTCASSIVPIERKALVALLSVAGFVS